MKKEWKNSRVIGLLGATVVITSALVTHLATGFLQAALPGVDTPLTGAEANFKGNPEGNYAGPEWDPNGNNLEEANKHAGKIVFYQHSDPEAGTYYKTASLGNNNTKYNGIYSDAVVHCPTGATVSEPHNSHLAYSPNLSGMYDGPGHQHCMVTGIGIDPLPGPAPGQPFPRAHLGNHAKLYKTQGGAVDYYTFEASSYLDNEMTDLKAKNDGVVACPHSMIGPFDTDAHYLCLSDDGSRVVMPVTAEKPAVSTASFTFTNYATQTTVPAATTGSVDPSASGAKMEMYFTITNTGSNSDSYYFSYVSQQGVTCNITNVATGAGYSSQTKHAPGAVVNYKFDCAFNGVDTTKTELTMTVSAYIMGISTPLGPLSQTIGFDSWGVAAPFLTGTYGIDLTTHQSTFNSGETMQWTADFKGSGAIPSGSATFALELCTDAGYTACPYRYTTSFPITKDGDKIIFPISEAIAPAGYYYRMRVESFEGKVSPWAMTSAVVYVKAAAGESPSPSASATPSVSATPTGTPYPSSSAYPSGSPYPTGTAYPTSYPTSYPTQGCTIGQTCKLDGNNDWCQNGNQCYNADYETFTCVDWHEQCPSGTKTCMPETTAHGGSKCIEPGEYGTSNDWCSRGQSCYSDTGRMYCDPFNYDPAAHSTGMMTEISCPAGMSICRPGDDSCIAPGETGPSTGWCAGGRQCHMPNGDLYCTKSYDEGCPTEASACRSDDPFCIDTNETGPVNGWCGDGESIMCYLKDNSGIFCKAVEGTNHDRWETTECPSDSQRCRPDDQWCLELGETGPSGSWCTSGMTDYNTDGTVTCKKWDDHGPQPPTISPDPIFCSQVITPAYDPSTGECSEFPTPCDVPTHWQEMDSEKVCRDGKITTIEVSQEKLHELLDRLYVDEEYLRNVKFQIKRLPSSVQGVKKVQILIEEGQQIIKKIRGIIESTRFHTKADVEDIKAALKTLQKEIMPDIDEKMESIRAYIDLEQVRIDLNAYDEKLDELDKTSEHYERIKKSIQKIETLLDSITGQKGQGFSKLFDLIRDEEEKIRDAFIEAGNINRRNSTSNVINDLIKDVDRFRDFMKEKEVTDEQIVKTLLIFQEAVEQAEKHWKNGDTELALDWLDEAFGLRGDLKHDLRKIGLTGRSSADDIEAIIEERFNKILSEKVNQIVDRVTNKMTVLLDEKMKEMTENMAKITTAAADRMGQSLSNLAVVAKEHQEKIAEAKNTILKKVENIEEKLRDARVSLTVRRGIENLIADAATKNWCGKHGDKVQTKVNSLSLALEAGEVTEEEVTNMGQEIESLDNDEECFKIGASPFRDTPMHEWYFESAHFNNTEGYIQGYKDENGQSKGQFGPADQTLGIEALAMAMRVFDIREGNANELSVPVKGVPAWGIKYINGAVDAGLPFDRNIVMDQPISRADAAALFVAIGGKHFTLPKTYDTASKYNDYAEFKGNKEHVQAIEALSDLGVLKGYQGNVNPKGKLLRSEFATVNMRLVNELGLKK